MAKHLVTKEQFHSYQKVQFSGECNMWGAYVPLCNDDDMVYIMKHYKELEEEYGSIEEE